MRLTHTKKTLLNSIFFYDDISNFVIFHRIKMEVVATIHANEIEDMRTIILRLAIK